MSDLIDRQAAISLPVMPKKYRKYQTYNLDDAYEQGWEDLQKCIERLPSAQPHWIPCSERLPKYPFRVQIQLDNGWIITGYYSEEHWYTVPHCGGFLRNDEVEAWRELPKSYDGGDAK